MALAGGLGWLSDPIIELAQSGPAAERIRLIGYVAEEHLPALLAAARFFCYPSLFEGFGLPVLEAQRAGAPVMTSNTSSLPEIAGDAALLVDPLSVDDIAAGLFRILTDGDLKRCAGS